MKSSLIILAFAMLGVFLGYFDLTPEFFVESNLSLYTLYILLFVVGISIGFDIKALLVLREMRLNILFVPFGILAASLLSAAIMAIPLGMHPVEGMVVAATVGYYSLGSILVTEGGNVELASLTLLANVLREFITLTFPLFLIKSGGKLAPIMTSGAAAMDTCLPNIARFSGERYALIAIFSGIVLTIAVPILVPFLLTFL